MEADKPRKILKKVSITLLVISFFDILTLTLFMLISWVLRLFPLSEIKSLGSLNIPIFISLLFSTITGIVITLWVQNTVLKKLLTGMLTILLSLIPLFILNAVIGGFIVLWLFSIS